MTTPLMAVAIAYAAIGAKREASAELGEPARAGEAPVTTMRRGRSTIDYQ
jgi:hypothetical protein